VCSRPACRTPSVREKDRVHLPDDATEYRDVTPLAWGERFHDQDWVSRPAMQLVAARGGRT
jgi:hypothetical protein